MAEQQKRDAIFGHFGYEVFSNGIIVPFVYRSDAHLFSTTMLQKHLPLKEPNVQKIEYLKNHMIAATSTEIKLLDEVNLVHNDGCYPKISCFEKLLPTEDVTQIVKFEIDCVDAKNGLGMKCGGFLRFALINTDDKEYILPYYVKNGTNMTPVDLVKKITQIKQAWNIEKLENVEVLYMKFLVGLYKCDFQISEPTLNCVTTDGLKELCSRIKEYWPKSIDSLENTVIPSTKTTANNNMPKHEDEISRTAKIKIFSIDEIVSKIHNIDKFLFKSTPTNNNEPKPENVVIPATNNNKPKNEDDVISTVKIVSKDIKRKHENVETLSVSKSTKSKNAKHENANNLIANKGKNNNKRRIIEDSDEDSENGIHEAEKSKRTKSKNAKHENANNLAASKGKNKNDRQIAEDSDEDSDEELEEGYYVVEKILKCRPRNGGEALVRWKGYSPDEDTWEPLKNLDESLRKEARQMLSKKRK